MVYTATSAGIAPGVGELEILRCTGTAGGRARTLSASSIRVPRRPWGTRAYLVEWIEVR